MGSTLEAQKAKAPKPKPRSKSKSKVIEVSPGEPYYSSSSLGERFNQRMMSAIPAAKLKANSNLGGGALAAAAIDAGAAVQDIFQDEEGKRGSRLARKAATEIIKRNDGGIAKKTRIF
jgi:hypothetical protein|tara:strand:+ start:250 stop:603 length:354 start_codon:yes stop_codon:yes gene_type:complete